MRMIAYMLAGVFLVILNINAQEPPAQVQVPAPQAPGSSLDLKTLRIAKVPLAPGPLLTPAPNQAQWMVTSTLIKQQPGGPVPATINIKVNKTNKIYEVESVTAQGDKVVRWSNGSMVAVYLPGAPGPAVACNGASPFYIDFSNTDYPDFVWISSENYKGVSQLGPEKVLIFKEKVRLPERGAGPIPFLSQTVDSISPLDAIAAVDLATHKPLILQVANEQLAYQFTTATPNLAMPKDAQVAFSSLMQLIERATP